MSLRQTFTSCLAFLVCAFGLLAQGLNTNATKGDWEEINFESGSAVLVDGYPSLLRLAELLSKNEGYKVRIEGHQDALEAKGKSGELAMRRANTVKQFLEKYGVRPSQIAVSSAGGGSPKAANATREGRFMNRRAQLTVTDPSGKVISDGGVGDAIRGLNSASGGNAAMADPKCCDEILKRLDKLDDILGMLRNMKADNDRLKADVDGLKRALAGGAGSGTGAGSGAAGSGAAGSGAGAGGAGTSGTGAMAAGGNALAGGSGNPLADALNATKRRDNITASSEDDLDPLKRYKRGFGEDEDQTNDPLRQAAAVGSRDAAGAKFGVMGLNAGPDSSGRLTASGKGRYFQPLNKNLALQSEAEYMYFRDRNEGQFDFGMVNRIKRLQTGIFGSFKTVGMREFDNQGWLGQASFGADYLFGRGRVGAFGSKGFLNNSVVGRQALNRNVFLESYLRVSDQIGGSAAVGLWGNSWVEGNLGMVKGYATSNKPGGLLRYVQPINNLVAISVEGGLNETLIGRNNSGAVRFGLLFGSWLRPKQYLAAPGPVPMEIPRVRYELLQRRVRTGNDAPVADAGPDQQGVAAGQMRLDGSASFDPDGDPITYEWTQIAGPAVSLTGANTARPSFTATEMQTYSFRLTVRDDKGAQAIARTTVTTRGPVQVRIVRYQANPATIRPGQTSTLLWQVENAETVEIGGIGRVDPRQGTTQVSPSTTTTYRLTARNGSSEVNETVTVTVEQPSVRILAFSANPSSISSGQSSTLNWATENATSVEISGVGSVPVNGSTVVTPGQTTTYTITARNQAGAVSAATTVTVGDGAGTNQAPRIIRFTGDPLEIEQGNASNLSWVVENADSVQISSLGTVDLSGTRPVSPAASTIYTLIATNRFGSSNATLGINVRPATPRPPTLTACTASPAEITEAGQPVQLSYTATNANVVTLNGLGISNPFTVRPTGTTTYTLVAYGANNVTASCQVTVTLRTPVIEPGPTIVLPDNVTTLYRELVLDASATVAQDGGPLTFRWTSNNRTSAILEPNSARTRIQLGEQFGPYVFTLTVTDSKGRVSTKSVTVNFVSTRVF